MTSKATAKEPSAGDGFRPLLEAFQRDPGVSQGSMFGAPGLKVGGKVFAMLVKGKLVVKLRKERVAALVAAGEGEHFDPGHGRLMKEWVAVGSGAKAGWLGLAKEAREFVEFVAKGR